MFEQRSICHYLCYGMVSHGDYMGASLMGFRKCLFVILQSKDTMLSRQKQSPDAISSIEILVCPWWLRNQAGAYRICKANAVARIDNLEFLTDVVPRTMTYREFKEKKAAKGASRGIRPLQTGQTTLDGKRPGSSHIADQIHPSNVVQNGRIIPSEESVQRPDTAHSPNGIPHANGSFVFEHYEPNSNARHDETEDVEMT